jgi:hypothetical protein
MQTIFQTLKKQSLLFLCFIEAAKLPTLSISKRLKERNSLSSASKNMNI